MLSRFSLPVRQMFAGNILLAVCCIFYLGWWGLAFKPVGAVKGMKSGWLLIPAFVTGVAAVILAIRGIQAAQMKREVFPGAWIIWGGIVAYLILLFVTSRIFKRPVTTELILIVGWAMLAMEEIHALYGIMFFGGGTSAVFAVVISGAAIISLICYVLYYNLESRSGYIDGMIPLIMAGAVMVAIAIKMAGS